MCRPGVPVGLHGHQGDRDPAGRCWSSTGKTERRVGAYYFYILDPEFGPGFIKICTYCPYPAKVWLNGHEWAKRQATEPGSRSPRCPTGSRPAISPERLQAICDRLGPEHVQAFFDRWITQHPNAAHRRGPGRRLLVGAVDAPSRGVPHAGVRRPPPRPSVLRSAWSPTTSGSAAPKKSRAVFGRDRQGRPTQHPYQTRIFTTGTEVQIDFRYKHSRVKQYLKDGRAPRIETVINKPTTISTSDAASSISPN